MVAEVGTPDTPYAASLLSRAVRSPQSRASAVWPASMPVTSALNTPCDDSGSSTIAPSPATSQSYPAALRAVLIAIPCRLIRSSNSREI